MSILNILRSPWAIMPDRLLEMQAIYARWEADGTNLEAITARIAEAEARIGRPLSHEQQDYALREGGVAVLPIQGAIANKANMFMRVSGGASAQMLVKQMDSMAADPRVRAAVIDGDTPGGSVFGIPELGASIRRLADVKPTVTVSTGMLASAGYWAGSAANGVYASGPTDVIGSIGVVMTHNYNPRSAGQTTEITAGRYKRMGTDTKPLDPESEAYLQSQVDHLYGVFVDTVAKQRGVSVQDVLDRMADGRVFIGQQALDAGLIDGFATVDDMVEQLATNPTKFAARRKAVFALGALPGIEASATMPAVSDIPEINGEVPDVAHAVIPASVQTPATPEAGPELPAASATQPVEDLDMDPKEQAAKFAAENPQAAAMLRAEGSAAELARIKEVRAAALPGHDALIEQLAMDGKTTGAQAAMAVIAAERTRHDAAAKARMTGAPAPLAAVAPEADPGDKTTEARRKPSAAKAYAGLNAH